MPEPACAAGLSGRTALVWLCYDVGLCLTPFAMNTLVALDSSTEFLAWPSPWATACAACISMLASRHAELTLPTPQSLAARTRHRPGCGDAIAFGNGPGASPARALAVGWRGFGAGAQMPLIPVSTWRWPGCQRAPCALACPDARMARVVYWRRM